jgi:hypothetical protein
MSGEDDRLESVTEGETLRLKKGRLPHVKIREWEFKTIEKGKAILLSPTGLFCARKDDKYIKWIKFHARSLPPL